MKEGKPFFVKIVIADLLAELLKCPEENRGTWVTEFVLHLASGEGNNRFAKQVLTETENYRQQQAENGRKRWEELNKRKERVAQRALASLEGRIAEHEGRTGNSSSSNNNRSSNNTEAITEEESKEDKSIKPLSGKPDEKPPLPQYPYEQILAEMNTILSTRFKNTTTFKKLIRARMNEGFTQPDFADVCQKKKAEWGSDLKMMQYLRPDTLFGNKMNSYLGSLATGPPVSERERINHAAGQEFLNRRRNVWKTGT